MSSVDLEALGALLQVEDSDDTAETIVLLAAAGLLEVVDGTLTVTEAGRNAPEGPLETWNEVVAAYLGRMADSVGEGPLAELIDLSVTQALLLLYSEPEPVIRKDLIAATWQTARKAMETSFNLDQSQVRKAMKEVVEETVTQALTGLESMGAVRIVGDDGDHLTLSPLGIWGARQLFLDGPFEAPVVGDLQIEDADVLLDGLVDMRPDVADAELRLWYSARGDAAAAKELVAAAHAAAGAQQAMMAVHALGSIEAVAETAIRELLDAPISSRWPTPGSSTRVTSDSLPSTLPPIRPARSPSWSTPCRCGWPSVDRLVWPRAWPLPGPRPSRRHWSTASGTWTGRTPRPCSRPWARAIPTRPWPRRPARPCSSARRPGSSRSAHRVPGGRRRTLDTREC